MSKVYIKYGFIFDPAQAWPTQAEFEMDLGRYFKEKGMKPELVEAAPGQEEISIVYLTKTTALMNVEKQPVEFSAKGEKPSGQSSS